MRGGGEIGAHQEELVEQGCGALVSKTLAFNVHRDGHGEGDAALLPGQERLQLLREAPRQNRSARPYAIVGRSSTRGFPSLGNSAVLLQAYVREGAYLRCNAHIRIRNMTGAGQPEVSLVVQAPQRRHSLFGPSKDKEKSPPGPEFPRQFSIFR